MAKSAWSAATTTTNSVPTPTCVNASAGSGPTTKKRWTASAQRGSWHLYGHTHGTVRLRGAALDVGIDAHPEFRLWSWDEIRARLAAIPPLPYPPRHPKA